MIQNELFDHGLLQENLNSEVFAKSVRDLCKSYCFINEVQKCKKYDLGF